MSNLPLDLLWHEGMLLLPQHFQQQAARNELIMNWRLNATAPNSWGLRSMELDNAAMVHGLFRLRQLEAVLPDGFIVQHPNETNQSLEIDLSQYQDEFRSSPGLIYLVLPRTFNGAAGTQGELSRFTGYQPPPVVDAHTGDNEVIIDRCAPNLSLMAGEKPSDQFISLPIAEITCRDETYSLTRYIPPTLCIDGQSVIGQELESLAKRVREKAIFLHQRVQGLQAEGNDPDANDARDRLAAILSGLPKLELLLGSSMAHPFSIYTALADLMGALSILNRNTIPPRIHPYDHVNTLKGFDDITSFIHGCLDNVQERYRVIVFEGIDDGFSLQQLPDETISTWVLGVRMKPSQSESDAMLWMESAIIGSGPKIEEMIEKRVRGAQRQRIERVTAMDLLQTRETILFSITLTEETFEKDSDFRIMNVLPAMGDLKPLELALYTVNQI